MAKQKRKAVPTRALVKAAAPVEAGPVSVFERLAKDKSVDVDKMERLIAMHERIQTKAAEQEFNAAMSTAQKRMTVVSRDMVNPETHSRYASYGALDYVLRPIYTDLGFGLSFDTGESAPLMVRVLCHVTHTGGHARTYHADMPADGKGAKGGDVMTKTHATGAAMSYGMRYLLKMIFNVAIGEDDRDGNGPRRRQRTDREGSRHQEPSESPAPQDEPPVSHNPASGEKITDVQRKRLGTAYLNSGRTEEEVKGWLKRRYGVETRADIKRGDYDAIVRAIEAPGDLR